MNALSIDTATEVLALAASRDDAWASLGIRRGLQHSPALLPLAENLLRELDLTAADLQLVVCSLGPGSFTGIRIGLSTALGIGEGRHIPVVGVSTLDAAAYMWRHHQGDVIPVIDARKGKIYAALFTDGERRGGYRDIAPAELAEMLSGARSPILVGPDAPRIAAMLGTEWQSLPRSDAFDPRCLLRLGIETLEREGPPVTALRPLYLRKSEAEIASGR
jgi:tRNA threonylcarbamoyladenosine biosynthesis protein TsaB